MKAKSYLLLYEFTLASSGSVIMGTASGEIELKFGTIISKAMLKKEYPRVRDSLNEGVLAVELPTKKLKFLDFNDGHLLVEDAYGSIDPSVLCAKMLLAVPVEVLAQWASWPEIKGDDTLMAVFKMRMEGIL